jgi:RNA polymerase sigma factor (sigma-70 family)
MTFEFIYEKYFDDIYRYCYHRNDGDQYAAEEATKLTFDVVWRDWETVKEYPPERFMAWLYGVARNKIKEIRREQPPSTESMSEEWCCALIDEENLHKEPPDQEEEYQRFVEYIKQIRLQLKPKDWNLFRMRVVQEMSHREIGEALGIGENAAKLRWGRLEEKLRPIVAKILKNK